MARVTTALLTAGLLLATACGGDDGDTDSGGDNGDDTEAAGEGSEEAQAFCDEVTQLAQSMLSNLGEGAETARPEQQQQIIEDLRSVEPPAEIADDWNLLLDNSEEALASGQMPEATPEVSEASTNLSEYSGEHCTGTAVTVPESGS